MLAKKPSFLDLKIRATEGNIRYEDGAFSKWKKTLSRLLVKAAFISCFPLNP